MIILIIYYYQQKKRTQMDKTNTHMLPYWTFLPRSSSIAILYEFNNNSEYWLFAGYKWRQFKWIIQSEISQTELFESPPPPTIATIGVKF